MPRKIDVKVSDLIEILQKELKKVNQVSANLRCLIKILKEVKPKGKRVFQIRSVRADDGTDPCCGMCHDGNGDE